MIRLNNRLSACASLVSGKGTAVDVGTDHALLPAFLVQSGSCKSAVACDINQKPLDFARKTIQTNGLSDRIRLVLCDGLKGISPEGVSDIIIAGMGGELISSIISQAIWLKNGVNLILQPMTKAELLRKWLFENGFTIISELAARDEGLDYIIIQSLYCGEMSIPDEYYLYRGMVSAMDAEAQQYLLVLAERLRKIADGLSEASGKKPLAQKYYNYSQRIISEVIGFGDSRRNI